MVRTSLLWQEGPFCCELRPDTIPPTLAVRKHSDELVELEIHSELEARERAMALRNFVRAHLARASR